MRLNRIHQNADKEGMKATLIICMIVLALIIGLNSFGQKEPALQSEVNPQGPTLPD